MFSQKIDKIFWLFYQYVNNFVLSLYFFAFCESAEVLKSY